MKTNIRTLLIGLTLTATLFSCIDHRLGGSLSPAKLRLKKVEDGKINTTYTYDSQNRFATIAKADGSSGVYWYSDQPKYGILKQYSNPADQTTGTGITFPFDLKDNDEVNTYGLKDSEVDYSKPIRRTYYNVDDKKHVVGVTEDEGVPTPNFRLRKYYTYSGENITKGHSAVNRENSDNYIYEYDDKINPFYGSTDPELDKKVGAFELDLDDVLRFSRNNVIKITTTPFFGGAEKIKTIYSYEYNAQGLPIKRTTTQGGTGVLTYTYEPY